MINNRKVFHPGVYIKDYIEDSKITIVEFAEKIGVKKEELNLILEGKRNIDFNIAVRLSQTIGTSIDLWLNLQKKYDSYNK